MHINLIEMCIISYMYTYMIVYMYAMTLDKIHSFGADDSLFPDSCSLNLRHPLLTFGFDRCMCLLFFFFTSQSDIFSLFGSLMIWAYYPSYNSFYAPSNAQQAVAINTCVPIHSKRLVRMFARFFCKGLVLAAQSRAAE